MCSKYDPELVLPASGISHCCNCGHLKANHRYEGMFVGSTFYTHTQRSEVVDVVPPCTPLTATCLDNNQYNYNQIKSEMNDELHHKVTANRTDLFRGFKTISSGSSSSSSSSNRKTSNVRVIPTVFRDILFFDRLRKPQWVLPLNEADRHFYKEHSCLLENCSIPTVDVLKSMIINSGIRNQFLTNPMRDWFLWRKEKKDSRLEPTSYRSFNGNVNFPTVEAMEALLSLNQIAVSCNCRCDDLNSAVAASVIII
jgi:hypothetical protein